jgi:integrase
MQVALNALALGCGDVPISAMDGASVQAFRLHLSERVKDTTFNSYLIQIHAVFNLLQRRGFITSQHPIFAVKKTRVPDNIPDIISATDIDRFRSFLRRARVEEAWYDSKEVAKFWTAVFDTFYLTGMRRLQLCSLAWGDIDTATWTIRFKAESSKNGRSWTIPCPTQLRGTLKDLKKMTADILQTVVQPESPVFHRHLSTSIGRPGRPPISVWMSPAYVTNRLETISKQAKCDVLCSPHRLRHTAATRWLQAYGQIKTVKALLGHADGTHTYQYTHPEIENARDVLHRSTGFTA